MPTTHKSTRAKSHKKPHHADQFYQGHKIVTIRDAISGDPGFNGTDGQQAVIRLEDDHEEITVMRSEISDDE